jgi:hypothetical protein
MRPLAGPAMLLVIVGGFAIHRFTTKPESPSREFLDRELAGADAVHTGSCYSLSTVIVANTVLGSALLSWAAAGDDAWVLTMEDVQNHGGPVHVFQRFRFEAAGEQVRLVSVDASEGQNTDVDANIDALLSAPNERRSTPVDRCVDDDATGYHFRRRKK